MNLFAVYKLWIFAYRNTWRKIDFHRLNKNDKKSASYWQEYWYFRISMTGSLWKYCLTGRARNVRHVYTYVIEEAQPPNWTCKRFVRFSRQRVHRTLVTRDRSCTATERVVCAQTIIDLWRQTAYMLSSSSRTTNKTRYLESRKESLSYHFH